jgi:Zn finger protein HypA/HybF involved in hydrogenase expression
MKFKEATKLLFTAVIKLFGISILFGVMAYSFNIPIIGMMIIGFCINLFVGSFYTYYFNSKHEKLVVEQNKAILEYQSNKTAKVSCAYCHQENYVPIDLSNTRFKCPRCKHTNRLIAEFSAAQITVPQNSKDMMGHAVTDENADL